MEQEDLNKAIGYVFEVCEEVLTLLPQKAIYWQSKKVLIISDLHLGKAMHFRKHGIAVPGKVSQGNFSDLDNLINLTYPTEIIMLGDLFHSKHNSEWEQFKQWRCKYENITFHLVLGNHDILKKEAYDECQLTIHPDEYILKPFVFSHEPKPHSSSAYNLAGHIHPSVQVKGKGRQSLKFRCFYFGESYGLLPAFGNFTGTCVVEPLVGDSVFLILDNKVVKM